jgi:triosephosphate isomerase
MRQALVAGNWKMNGTQQSIASLLGGIKQGIASVQRAEVAVCPPFVYLPAVAQALQGTPIAWGAQNLSSQAPGAFTGEIAAEMLVDFQCKYVIVGHSERRSLYGETDEIVAEKFAVAQKAGLIPIFCLGELLEEREGGQTEAVAARQLDAVIARNGVAALGKAVIAYEPVWAIGTGKTASPQQAQDVHEFIRKRIAAQDAGIAAKVQILYGGSMKASNAQELLAMPDIDGGLIGGAALKADEFLAICQAAN